eukprot:COSAG06_NODE_44007_length_367_cov_0.578358_1_plen_90_part_10
MASRSSDASRQPYVGSPTLGWPALPNVSASTRALLHLGSICSPRIRLPAVVKHRALPYYLEYMNTVSEAGERPRRRLTGQLCQLSDSRRQ